MSSRFSLCLLCLVTGVVKAGVYIETADRDSKTGKSEPAERWYVQDGKARIEGSDGVSIFKDGIVYGVDPSSKSYHVMDKATMDQLTARMKQMREQRTQAELAKALGVTSNTVARWERDEMGISEPVARLAKAVYLTETSKRK